MKFERMRKKLACTLKEMEKHIKNPNDYIECTVPDDSPMVNYYRDKSVFLTGGTGFLGQLFVEKLLR